MCDRHEFFFEFDRAFNHQLLEKFEASPEHALAPDVASRRNGVYALYRGGELVYAGTALANTTLARRLGDHYRKVVGRRKRKIVGRRNIDVSEISCRYLVIDGDWFVRAAEDALIQKYQPLWQGSGFGGHGPGRGRPGIRPIKWEEEYPLKD